ncbi:MAG: hypothetical protein K2Q45_00945 [Nitrosomonas sp.]|nr:hypothetical protein [Nitrosomonas sp.]
MWQIAARQFATVLIYLFHWMLINQQKQNFLRRNMTLSNSIQTTAVHVRKEIADGEVSGTMDVFFRSGRMPQEMQR